MHFTDAHSYLLAIHAAHGHEAMIEEAQTMFGATRSARATGRARTTCLALHCPEHAPDYVLTQKDLAIESGYSQATISRKLRQGSTEFAKLGDSVRPAYAARATLLASLQALPAESWPNVLRRAAGSIEQRLP